MPVIEGDQNSNLSKDDEENIWESLLWDIDTVVEQNEEIVGTLLPSIKQSESKHDTIDSL